MKKDIQTIGSIDRNLDVPTVLRESDLRFYDIRHAEVDLHGLYNPRHEDVFRRLPATVAKTVSDGVFALSIHTAGGRVRFTTDSDRIAIRTVQPEHPTMPHMPLTGSSGFDLYIYEYGRYRYGGSFVPPIDMVDGYTSVITLPNRKCRDITINFPLYSCVRQMEIGLQPDATLRRSLPYAFEKPIVFYGSSITQGGCASRPGNAYQAIISRTFHCDYLNLGFSGCAHGETAMADYLATLDMQVCVLDYDHNAYSLEELDGSYIPLYHKIRAAHPVLPIIMATRTDIPLDTETLLLRNSTYEFIYNVYRCAVSSGDRNLYFLDGRKVFSIFGGDSCTVDGIHPNDLGFMCMAKAFSDVLRHIMQAKTP